MKSTKSEDVNNVLHGLQVSKTCLLRAFWTKKCQPTLSNFDCFNFGFWHERRNSYEKRCVYFQMTNFLTFQLLKIFYLFLYALFLGIFSIISELRKYYIDRGKFIKRWTKFTCRSHAFSIHFNQWFGKEGLF